MLSKQKDFTQDLLKENERLRFEVANLRQRGTSEQTDGLLRQEIDLLKKRLDQIETEKRELAEAYQRVEDENRDFAQRYIEIEEQNNNLANLYVASYQLHSTLDFQEVVHIVLEIVINLIGAEVFCVLLLDEKTNELGVIAQEGHEGPNDFPSVRIGDGILGEVAKSGEPYYINQAGTGYIVDYHHPIAAIPLKIKENVIGVISIYKLLVQKDAFTAVDYELFSLLAAHAATAIFSSKLYSQSERRLTTIQGFLDLLTAPQSNT